jgi:hypothetical protein
MFASNTFKLLKNCEKYKIGQKAIKYFQKWVLNGWKCDENGQQFDENGQQFD